MEATACVKSVIQAANQYAKNAEESHFLHLQRQLDVLISVTTKDSCMSYFNPYQLLPTECLTCLIDILNNPQTKPTLAHKVMILLNNLADEEVIRVSLHKTFNITSSLASYLKSVIGSGNDHIVLQCLKLLQKLTYNASISTTDTYVESLIHFLIKELQCAPSEFTQPCLGLLANLCRHNITVQAFIKSLSTFKTLCKCLANSMSSQSQSTTIYSLSTLTSLCLQEETGDQLYRSRNVRQTFQLMFNIMLNCDSSSSRRCAVDLFTDLLTHHHIQTSLTNFEHLSKTVGQVLELICTVESASIANLLVLLLSFNRVPGIRTVVYDRIIDYAVCVRRGVRSNRTDPMLALLSWARKPSPHSNLSTVRDSSLLALDLVYDVYESIVDNGNSGAVSSWTEELLPLLTEFLMTSFDGKQELSIKKQCYRVIAATKLMILMSRDTGLLVKVSGSIDTQTCTQILEYQLIHNPVTMRGWHKEQGDPTNWREPGVDVVLYTLSLMKILKPAVGNMEAQLNGYLQDDRVIPFISYGLTSPERMRVKLALNLTCTASALPQFHADSVSEAVADHISDVHKQSSQMREINNSHSASSSWLPVETAQSNLSSSPKPKRQAMSANCDNKENVFASNTKLESPESISLSLDKSVQSLIDKMQSGLELKDLRVSDIISLYERQLHSLQTNEDQLTDIIEAKKLALSHADTLNSKLRCRNAQFAAESSQLRALLKQSEECKEDLGNCVKQLQTEQDQNQKQLEELTKDKARLSKIADEHKDLLQNFTEVSQKYETCDRSLTVLRQEHQSMTDMYELMRKHQDTLKEQHDLSVKQVSELEKDKKQLKRQAKEKDAKLSAFKDSTKENEANLKKIRQERDELSKAIDNLRESLEASEKTNKHLLHEKSTLEIVYKRNEEELAKHAKIAALIHNLSSTNGAV